MTPRIANDHRRDFARRIRLPRVHHVARIEPLERRRLLTAGNIYVGVSRPNAGTTYDIYEYTPSGQQVGTVVYAPQSPGAGLGIDEVKDFVVDPSGNLQVYEAGFPTDGKVVTVAPRGAVLGSHTTPGMNLIGVTYYGGIATTGRYVFVPDMAVGFDTGTNQR